MATQTIVVPEEIGRLLSARVKSGMYRDQAEVLRAAMDSLSREEEEQGPKLAALRAAIQEGLESGIAEGDVLAQIRHELGLSSHAA